MQAYCHRTKLHSAACDGKSLELPLVSAVEQIETINKAYKEVNKLLLNIFTLTINVICMTESAYYSHFYAKLELMLRNN